MKKGFTLVELLIVLGVIALLIAVVIPTFQGMQKEAYLTQANKNIDTLQLALESYYKNKAAYPIGGSSSTVLRMLLSTTPRIVPSDYQLPTDPFKTIQRMSGHAPLILYYSFGYIRSTADPSFGEYYYLYSNGPDRVKSPGTTYATGGIMYVEGDDIVRSNAHIVKQ